MLTTLLIPVLLSCPMADGEPRRAAEGAPAFELTIHGVMGSSLDMRCPLTAGKPFTVRRTFAKGKHAEVRGELRATRDGKYVLEVSLPEMGNDGQSRSATLSTDLKVGEKGMLYLGWVRWYEVTLSRAK
jgi:hypothetical protein